MWNNPLNATDPSGYFLDRLGQSVADGVLSFADGISSFVRQPGKELFPLATVNYLGNSQYIRQQSEKSSRWIKRNERTLIAIAVTAAAFYVPVGPQLFLGQTFWGSAALGAVNGYISSGGDLRATAIGAISGGVFHGIGSAFGSGQLSLSQKIGKTLAHGVAGGVRSVAMGGNFEDGFRVAAVSQTFAVSGVYDYIARDTFSQGMASAAVGGLTSELTGGSFEDAAITAFLSHTTNDMAHAVQSASAVIAVGGPAALAEPTIIGEIAVGVAAVGAAVAGWYTGEVITDHWFNESDGSGKTTQHSVDRPLPTEDHRKPKPDVSVPHSQIGTSSGGYRQTREWGYDDKGKLVPLRDIDWTDHGQSDHANPHQHKMRQTKDGRSFRGKPKPLY